LALAHPAGRLEDNMSGERDSVRLNLTPSQREQVRQATNRDVEAIEFTPEELEQRIAPAKLGWKPTL
jgi:hypothetical protein